MSSASAAPDPRTAPPRCVRRIGRYGDRFFGRKRAAGVPQRLLDLVHEAVRHDPEPDVRDAQDDLTVGQDATFWRSASSIHGPTSRWCTAVDLDDDGPAVPADVQVHHTVATAATTWRDGSGSPRSRHSRAKSSSRRGSARRPSTSASTPSSRRAVGLTPDRASLLDQLGRPSPAAAAAVSTSMSAASRSVRAQSAARTAATPARVRRGPGRDATSSGRQRRVSWTRDAGDRAWARRLGHRDVHQPVAGDRAQARLLQGRHDRRGWRPGRPRARALKPREVRLPARGSRVGPDEVTAPSRR